MKLYHAINIIGILIMIVGLINAAGIKTFVGKDIHIIIGSLMLLVGVQALTFAQTRLILLKVKE